MYFALLLVNILMLHEAKLKWSYTAYCSLSFRKLANNTKYPASYFRISMYVCLFLFIFAFIIISSLPQFMFSFQLGPTVYWV